MKCFAYTWTIKEALNPVNKVAKEMLNKNIFKFWIIVSFFIFILFYFIYLAIL